MWCNITQNDTATAVKPDRTHLDWKEQANNEATWGPLAGKFNPRFITLRSGYNYVGQPQRGAVACWDPHRLKLFRSNLKRFLKRLETIYDVSEHIDN